MSMAPAENGAGAVEEAVVVQDHHGPREAADFLTEITPSWSRRNRHVVEETDPLIHPWPLLPDSAASAVSSGQCCDFWPELPGDEHLEPISRASHRDGSALEFGRREGERLRLLEREQRGVRWKE